MSTVEEFQAGFNKILKQTGRQIRIDCYNVVYDSTYDEAETLTLSGTTWTSGIVLPLTNVEGSQEAVLLEQGKLKNTDIKLYVSGNITFGDDNQEVEIMLGSPTGESYGRIPEGVIGYEVSATKVYKKVFLRRLTGSLL